uniref:Protein NipSnap n=1 Tax=Cacopsylla melanoneura TaxID=428564 RepID=A0A8D8SSS8_9HEMI
MVLIKMTSSMPLLMKTQLNILPRLLSTTTAQCSEKEGWLSKLQKVRHIEPSKESHSRMLSDKEVIFELHTHNIRPDSMDKYLTNYENQVNVVKSQSLNCDLVGSWTVQVGDMDQALHLWKYKGGFSGLDKTKLVLRDSQVIYIMEL